MKFRSKVRNVLAGAALVSLALSGCSGSSDPGNTDEPSDGIEVPFETVTEGKLTVAFYDQLPKIQLGANDDLEGVEGWLLTELAAKYGLEVVPMRTDFSGTLLAVQQGKADIGTNIYHTDERATQFTYTYPTVNDVFGFIMLADTPYSGPESLKGQKIGTVPGYTFTDLLIEYFGEENVLLMPDQPAMFAAVKNKQVAAYAGSSGSASAVVKANPDFKLEAVSKGDMDFSEAMRLAPAYQITSCSNKALADAASENIKEKRENGELDKKWAEWGLDGDPFTPELVRPALGC